MTKSSRLAEQLDAFEREYRSVLTRALNDCAAGRWGIFGHNEHLRVNQAPPELDELYALAEEIDRLRERIGEAPFALHEEFEAARGPVGPNALGEPKQAVVWLEKLANI